MIIKRPFWNTSYECALKGTKMYCFFFFSYFIFHIWDKNSGPSPRIFSGPSYVITRAVREIFLDPHWCVLWGSRKLERDWYFKEGPEILHKSTSWRPETFLDPHKRTVRVQELFRTSLVALRRTKKLDRDWYFKEGTEMFLNLHISTSWHAENFSGTSQENS